MIDLFERVAPVEVDVPVPCQWCGLEALSGDTCDACLQHSAENDEPVNFEEEF